MRIRRRNISAVIAALLVVTSISGFIYWKRECKKNAIKCTLEWGRLAPFPESAHDLDVEISGGIFTRKFVVSFTDDALAIRKWISDSPGFHDAKLARPTSKIEHYIISPGSGAQWAEVTIDDEAHAVKIQVWWS